MIHDDFLWVEKYRPGTVNDCILPARLKKTFQGYVDQENIPTLLLSGPAGIGKTSVAMAMLDELDCDWIKLNGSLEGRLIDTLRTTIIDFASTASFSGGRKYIILDEADYLNPQTVQPALRGFIEDYSDNCGFILTCNYKARLKPEIISRSAVVDFKLSKEEAAECAKQFFMRVKSILEVEKIKYEPKVIAEVIKKFFPDWRRVLNELQRYAVGGIIDSGILVDLKEVMLDELVGLMKRKDFKALRTWVAENSDIEPGALFLSFYTHAEKYLKPSSVPVLVLLIAKYQYQSAFVTNQEINNMAFFLDTITECQFNNGE